MFIRFFSAPLIALDRYLSSRITINDWRALLNELSIYLFIMKRKNSQLHSLSRLPPSSFLTI